MAKNYNINFLVQTQVDYASVNRAAAAVRNTLGKAGVGNQTLSIDPGNARTTLSRMNSDLAVTSARMRTTQRAADSMNRSLTATARVSLESSNFLSSFSSQAALATRRFLAFSLAAGTVVRLIGTFQDGVRQAIQFDLQMNRLAQVAGDAQDKLRGIRREINALSTNLGVSSMELAEVAVTLRQAGLEANDTQKALKAIALTDLAPNFENMKQTTEGLIAVWRQFKIEASDWSNIMGSLNAVAGKFAVEAADIVTAVQKAGGAFANVAGDAKSGQVALSEFIALFTSVRATTRESADTIATGLRTIFTRLQRSETVDALRALNINLRYTTQEAERLGNVNLTNQFVGAYEAVRRISDGLSGLRETDPRFAAIIEQLGGYRQVSKVIPLIKQQTVAQEALNVALSNQLSLEVSAEKRQESLANRIIKVKETYLSLIRSLVDSSGFQALANRLLSLADSFAKLLKFASPLLPLLTALASIKIATGIAGIARNFGGTFFSPVGSNTVVRRASGGIVPGSGNRDTVPALLTPGEFVIRKSSAQALGYDRLAKLNRFANGGFSKAYRFNEPEGTFVVSVNHPDYDVPFERRVLPGYKLKKQLTAPEENALRIYTTGHYQSINDALRKKGSKPSPRVARMVGNISRATRKGVLPDGVILHRGVHGPLLADYERQIGAPLDSQEAIGKQFSDTGFISTSLSQDTAGHFAGGYDGRGVLLTIFPKRGQNGVFLNRNKLTALGSEREVVLPPRTRFRVDAVGHRRAKVQTLAMGGNVPGIGNKDTVPALLTPGEFVINKDSAAIIGAARLNRLNSLAKFNTGGFVRMAEGGDAETPPKIPQRRVAEFVDIIDPAVIKAIQAEAEKMKVALTKGTQVFLGAEGAFEGFVDAVEEATNSIKKLRGYGTEGLGNKSLALTPEQQKILEKDSDIPQKVVASVLKSSAGPAVRIRGVDNAEQDALIGQIRGLQAFDPTGIPPEEVDERRRSYQFTSSERAVIEAATNEAYGKENTIKAASIFPADGGRGLAHDATAPITSPFVSAEESELMKGAEGARIKAQQEAIQKLQSLKHHERIKYGKSLGLDIPSNIKGEELSDKIITGAGDKAFKEFNEGLARPPQKPVVAPVGATGNVAIAAQGVPPPEVVPPSSPASTQKTRLTSIQKLRDKQKEKGGDTAVPEPIPTVVAESAKLTRREKHDQKQAQINQMIDERVAAQTAPQDVVPPKSGGAEPPKPPKPPKPPTPPSPPEPPDDGRKKRRGKAKSRKNRFDPSVHHIVPAFSVDRPIIQGSNERSTHHVFPAFPVSEKVVGIDIPEPQPERGPYTIPKRGRKAVSVDELPSAAKEHGLSPSAMLELNQEARETAKSLGIVVQYLEGSTKALVDFQNGIGRVVGFVGDPGLGSTVEAVNRYEDSVTGKNELKRKAEAYKYNKAGPSGYRVRETVDEHRRKPKVNASEIQVDFLAAYDKDDNLVGGSLAKEYKSRVDKEISGLSKRVPLTDSEKDTIRASQLAKLRNETHQQIYNVERHLLRQLYPQASAAQIHAKATENAAKALEGQAKVVKNANGKIIGLASTVEQAQRAHIATTGDTSLGGTGNRRIGLGARIGDLRQSLANRANNFLGRAGTSLTGVGSIALLTATPFITNALESRAGSADAAAAAGTGREFASNKAVSGGFQGALVGGTVGATLGSAIAPGIGTAIGAVVGATVFGVRGFVDSLKQAEQEIRDVKINNALTSFADKLNTIQNIGVSGSSPEVITAALSDLRAREAESRAKNLANAEVGFFTSAKNQLFGGPVGFDSEAFIEAERSSLRQNFAGQLPQIMTALQREAEKLGRANVSDNISDLSNKLRRGGDGLSEELIKIVAKVRNVPITTVLEELEKNISAAQQSSIREQRSLEGNRAEQRSTNTLGRFLSAVQSSANSLSKLEQSALGLSDVFNGTVSGAKVNIGSEGFARFGSLEGAAIRPLSIIRAVGGEFGQSLFKLGKDVDDASRVLPDILASVAANVRAGDTSQTVDAQIIAQVRSQLGKEPDDRLITSLQKALGEATKDGSSGLLGDIETDATKTAERLLANFASPVKEYGEKIAKDLQDNANKFVDAVAENQNRLRQIAEGFDQLANLQTSTLKLRAQFDAERAGRPGQAFDSLSIDTLEQGFNARQRRLAGDAAFNPAEIGGRLRKTTEEIDAAIKKQQEVFNVTGGNSQEFRDAANEVARLKSRAADYQSALKDLTDVTNRNKEIQEKLNRIQQEREGRLGLAERYATATPEERFQLDRAAALANASNNDPSLFTRLSAEDRRSVLDFLGSAGATTLTGFAGAPRADDLRRNLLRGFQGGTFDLTQQQKDQERALQDEAINRSVVGEQALQELISFQQATSEKLYNKQVELQERFFSRLESNLKRESILERENALGQAKIRQGEQSSQLAQKQLLSQIGVRDQSQLDAALRSRNDITSLADAYNTARSQRRQLAETIGSGRFDEALRAKGQFISLDGDGTLNELSRRKIQGVLSSTFPNFSDTQQSAILKNVEQRLKNSPVDELPKLLEGNKVLRDAVFAEFDKQISTSTNKVTTLEGRLSGQGIDVGAIARISAEPDGTKKIRDALDTFSNLTFAELDKSIKSTTAELGRLEDELKKLRGAPDVINTKPESAPVPRREELYRPLNPAAVAPGQIFNPIPGARRADAQPAPGYYNVGPDLQPGPQYYDLEPGLKINAPLNIFKPRGIQDLQRGAPRGAVLPGPERLPDAPRATFEGANIPGAVVPLLPPQNPAEKLGNLGVGFGFGVGVGSNTNGVSNTDTPLQISAEAISAFNRLSSSFGNLDQSFTIFGGHASALAAAINNMPRSLNIQGQHQVNVVINGAEVLAKIMPEMQNLVVQEVRNSLSRIFREQMPEAGIQVD